MCERNIAGEQFQRVDGQVVGAKEFAVIEKGPDVLQHPVGGGGTAGSGPDDDEIVRHGHFLLFRE